MRAVSLIRWCRPGVVATAVCCLAVAGRAQEAKPDVDQEMKASLQRTFTYKPESADAAPPKVAPDMIVMRRIVVLSRWESEGLDAAIARQEAIDDRFTLYKGGAIFSRSVGRVRVEVGTWYNDDHEDENLPGSAIRGLNLLKLSW
jgi:hypothetical protein